MVSLIEVLRPATAQPAACDCPVFALLEEWARQVTGSRQVWPWTCSAAAARLQCCLPGWGERHSESPPLDGLYG